MRQFKTLTAVIGLVFSTAPAVAGPIFGGYEYELLGTTVTPGDLDPGKVMFTELPSAVPGVVTAVTLTPYLGGPGAGSYTDPNWVEGNSDGVSAESRFDVKVRITDPASGQSGVVAVTGIAHADWNHRWDGLWLTDHAWVSGAGWGDLILGDTRYVLRVDEVESFGDPVTSRVTIQTTPAETAPEPGTLGLAAAGLAPVFGVVLRRRRGV